MTYHELLECLHDVDEMARFGPVYTVEGVAEALQREAGGVESQEHLVQDPATPECSSTKDYIESDTGTVTDTGKDETRRESAIEAV